jgi:hypothetical protein
MFLFTITINIIGEMIERVGREKDNQKVEDRLKVMFSSSSLTAGFPSSPRRLSPQRAKRQQQFVTPCIMKIVLLLNFFCHVSTITFSWAFNPATTMTTRQGQQLRRLSIRSTSSREGPYMKNDNSIALFSTGASGSSSSISNSNKENDQPQQVDLLEKARLLREQAKALEEDLRSKRNKDDGSRMTTSSLSSTTTSTAPIVYTKLEDSIWTISYRFSSQPAPEDNETTKQAQQEQERKKVIPRTFYSGKFNVRLKDDGYSERITFANAEQQQIEIDKIWGWDVETSNEDDNDYVLFSMDVQLPSTDPDLPNQRERYYFQARVDRSSNDKSISLKDGTITVKKDVAETTRGRWGLFNVAGILSQFRYCGDFVAKPSSSSPSSS